MDEDQRRLIEKAAPVVSRQVGGDFTKVDTAERKQILLRAAPHARSPSILWTKDRRLTKRFFVKRFLEFQNQIECEFADRASRVLGEVDQELDLAGSNDIYVNARCEESTLFFHVNRRDVSSRNGLLLISIPKDLYEVQRRAQLRYRCMAQDDFRLGSEIFKIRLENTSILDISSGGVGIQLKFDSDESSQRFTLKDGERVQFHLDLGILNFKAMGEARYFRRMTDEDSNPVIRLGLRFVGLTQDMVEAVQMLVLERSYVRFRQMFKD
jgi:c-di-GMP-binding flagellar brake protein YcgR